jgi:hypothetical protein
MKTLDSFTRAYITTALRSSTEYAFGECPCCEKRAILSHYPEPEYDQEPMCSECGVTEIANPDPMGDNYTEDDIAPDTIAKMESDVTAFFDAAREIIEAAIETGRVKCGPDFDERERAAHDFWLTRNGHGAGFWDGDWPEPMAGQLTAIAHGFGECDLYVGDDGEIYL